MLQACGDAPVEIKVLEAFDDAKVIHKQPSRGREGPERPMDGIASANVAAAAAVGAAAAAGGSGCIHLDFGGPCSFREPHAV